MCFYICVLHALGLSPVLWPGLHAAYSVWAAGKAWGYWMALTFFLTCLLCLSVSVAFLGDIALDEEDLRLFKVDRIIDLAQRTVQTVNHTDTGNNNSTHKRWEKLFWILTEDKIATKVLKLIYSPQFFSFWNIFYKAILKPLRPSPAESQHSTCQIQCVFLWALLKYFCLTITLSLHIATPVSPCSTVIVGLCQVKCCSWNEKLYLNNSCESAGTNRLCNPINYRRAWTNKYVHVGVCAWNSDGYGWLYFGSQNIHRVRLIFLSSDLWGRELGQDSWLRTATETDCVHTSLNINLSTWAG